MTVIVTGLSHRLCLLQLQCIYRSTLPITLSDEIRVLCDKICEDMTNGDHDLYWA